jgi:low molecular weight protein-tyrosine phosphatase
VAASILLVCTGNICRSPIAEGLVRKLADELGASVEVGSVGVVGWEGSPAVHEAVLAAAERGADISGHVARRLEVSHVEEADLILCMAAEHRDAVVRLVPEGEPRTFTLKELARLLEEGPSDGSVQERVRAAHDLRRSGFESGTGDEDVADPLGMSMDMFRAVAWDIDEWCVRLAKTLFAAAEKVLE